MASDKDFKIKEKKKQAIILLMILFIPMCVALFFTGQFFNEKNVTDQETLGVGVLNNIVSHMDTMSQAAVNQYNSNLSERMNVRVSFLKEDVKNGKYIGPHIFSDGFVIRLDGDHILYPIGAPRGEMKVTPQLITTSIASGQMRTGRLTTNISSHSHSSYNSKPVEDDTEADSALQASSGNTADTGTDSNASEVKSIDMTEGEGITQFNKELSETVSKQMSDALSDDKSSVSVNKNAILNDYEYALSFARITEKDIFVAVTSEMEFSNYVSLYTIDTMSALKNAAEISDGMIVLVSEMDGNLSIKESYGKLEGLTELPESAINKDILNVNDSDSIYINGQKYRYICVEADSSFLDSDRLYILHVYPSYSFDSQMFLQSVLICMLMLLIFVTLSVYTLSEQSFVVDNVMTKDEAVRYSPKKLRRKLTSAGIAGAIAIFVFAFLSQAVGQLHQHIRYGEYTLQLITGSIKESIEDQAARIRSYQEHWYVDSGAIISSYLSERPELATQEKLEELSHILEADYIMVFDSKGKEYVSSNDYVGFSLSHGLGSDSTDFQSLLMGIPYIIHDPSTDKLTRQKRQFIGVTMDAIDDPAAHGALILSLLPDQTDVAGTIVDVNDEMALALNEDSICFYADSSTGEILRSTLPALEGRTVKECGLSEVSLQDGYMDFGTIDNADLFIVTRTLGEKTYYYATQYSTLMFHNLMFSLICIVLYTLTLIFIIHGLMRHYNDSSYKKWITVLLPNLPARWKIQDPDETAVFGEEVKKSPLQLLRRRERTQKPEKKRNSYLKHIAYFFKWDTRLPEEKSSLVFYIGMSLMMLIWCLIICINEENIALMKYLLYGDWNRGINTFSLYCIILTLAISNLIITISSWILFLFAGFLSSKGDTICKLLRSIIKYITIIAAIFFSLSYIGLLNSTVIASVGLGSVILSLGAKDIVADILSGILIVFEQTLRIGDIVQYDGKTGIVQEVGMRTTKLELIPANDILEVRNHEIATVINMSKYASYCILPLKIRATESLERIEDLLNQNLKSIGKDCNKILGAPAYVGVSRVGSDGNATIPMITIAVSFNCNQKDYYQAYYHLNKELHNLFEKNNISLY